MRDEQAERLVAHHPGEIVGPSNVHPIAKQGFVCTSHMSYDVNVTDCTDRDTSLFELRTVIYDVVSGLPVVHFEVIASNFALLCQVIILHLTE